MFNLKSAFLGLFSAILISNLTYADEIGHVPISLDNFTLTHSHTTQGLKPISDSYKLAKLQFLPELENSETGWAGNNIGSAYNRNDCSAYPLSSCPAKGKCTKCPVGAGYRVNSCISPYILSNGTCSCPPVVSLTNPNDVCTAYCSPRAGAVRRCIAKSCTPSANQTSCTRGTYDCNDGCGKTTRKCCNPCTHTVTSKPANSSYVYSSCIDGDGRKDIQTGWTCNKGYHKTSSNTCVKDCNVTNCAGYTLSSCPANGTCSTCTKTAANCSTDGIMYKLDSCKDGYTKSGDTCIKGCPNGQTLVDGSCVACASSLTYKNANGTSHFATKVTYNGTNYAVFATQIGLYWKRVKEHCFADNYNSPKMDFAKYLMANRETLGLGGLSFGGDNYVRTSTQCGSTQYIGCNSPTSCTCLPDDTPSAVSPLCVKPLCPNFASETCPEGYRINKCSSPNETQTGTATSSLGKTCYKCENKSSSSGSGSSGTSTCVKEGYHPDCCATGFTGKKCYIPNYNCAARNSCTSWDLQHTYANCIRDLGNGYYCCSQCSGYEVN